LNNLTEYPAYKLAKAAGGIATKGEFGEVIAKQETLGT